MILELDFINFESNLNILQVQFELLNSLTPLNRGENMGLAHFDPHFLRVVMEK